KLTAIAGAVLLTALHGCVTTVDVEKFTGTQDGFRYSLPQPYILVTPRADGGIDVQPLVLPDSANEYVARPTSFLSTCKFEISVEKNLLKAVTANQDATAVAAALATDAGAVAKAQLDRQAEKGAADLK